MGNTCCKSGETTVVKQVIIYSQLKKPDTHAHKVKLNPYDQNVSQISQLPRQDHYQRAIKDQGIHEDYMLNPAYFQICSLCGGQYGSKLKPVLLQCGHFLCLNCYKQCSNCLIYNCQKPINHARVSIFTFKKQQFQPPMIKGRQYSLLVKIGDKNHANEVNINVHGSLKFSEMCQKNIQLKSFSSNPNFNIIIKSASKKYDQIKNKSIDQLAYEMKLNPIQDGKSAKNIIKVYDKQNGGKIKNL